MACVANQLTAPCGTTYNNNRTQLISRLLLLCQVLANLDPEYSCENWNLTLLSAQNDGLTCFTTGQNRAIAAQAVCDGLEVDCASLNCFDQGDLEAMHAYLTCRIINELNP